MNRPLGPGFDRPHWCPLHVMQNLPCRGQKTKTNARTLRGGWGRMSLLLCTWVSWFLCAWVSWLLVGGQDS